MFYKKDWSGNVEGKFKDSIFVLKFSLLAPDESQWTIEQVSYSNWTLFVINICKTTKRFDL